jgi:two-component system, chemotaxis family, CheB/CheR fusion protein
LAEDESFEDLIKYLKEARNFDFSGYKRSSLARRVNRQMQDVGITGYDEYRDYLELQPEEFTALFNTILINVTSFFRDADAWTHLREVIIPELLRTSGRERIRVWSAGCASGEEAYSLAICLAEVLGADEFRRRVKIYATDVDEEALAEARQAVYTERDLQALPPELRERYFDPAAERWAFSKELRRSVIFGRNDLIMNAPISHIDLLVCRNTLMYFNSEAQANILRRMHFALEPEGALFLGKAEMLLSHGDLFKPMDLKRRFFCKVSEPTLRDRSRLILGMTPQVDDSQPQDHSRLYEEALSTGPLAQVIIDGEGRLALSNRRADDMFSLSGTEIGRPFQDLELSYRPAELRSSLQQAITERRSIWVREVEWARNDGKQWLDIQIVPLHDKDGILAGTSVYFNDVSQLRQLQRELEYAHRQLETAYEELQSTNEELETTNEELQSTVEELETTNEELQSTNEELETMNEELQSMNDELQTSNDELRERTAQVDDLNVFMRSILGSLEAGVAVVDHELKVQVWNTRMEELWGVRNDEAVGQYLLNLDIGLPVEELRPTLRQVLTEDGSDQPIQMVRAVNRRGRSIDVQVTISPLHRSSGSATVGAIILMDSRAVLADE